ncbi:MAG: hypothetical protein V7637_444 [Mycobacteriales bacterium]|jgi:hypothetical protein
MTDVSAIPFNLYSYSDACTHAAQQLQDWVHGVLGPALREYQNGGGTCFTIDADTAAHVSATYHTDRDVRLVGKAFERAGHAPPGPLTPYSAPEKEVDATYRALKAAAEHGAEMRAGAALAAKMSTHRDARNIEWITHMLGEHAGDKYFAAGFFNSLSADQIAELLGHGRNTRALVSAYASGALTPETMNDVVRALTWVQGGDLSPQHWHITPGVQVSVLKALAADKAAAANFAKLLTTAQARKLFDSSPARNGRAWNDYGTQVAFLDLLATAADAADSSAAKELLEKVAPAFSGTPSADELRAVMPALSAFLVASTRGLLNSDIGPLTGNPAEDDARIGKWATANAANLGLLKEYVEWVSRGEEKFNLGHEKQASSLAELGIDLVVAGMLEKVLPVEGDKAAKAARLGIHALIGTGAVQTFEPWIARALSEGGNKEFDAELARLINKDLGDDAKKPKEVLGDVVWQKSRVLTTILAFQQLPVYRTGAGGHARRVTLHSEFGTTDPGQLQVKVLRAINSGDWARHVEIRGEHGHIMSLEDLLANLSKSAHGSPNFW